MPLVESFLNQRARSRRPHRETLLFLLMGQTSLLMQVAHPSVARAVREHSSYDSQPMRRLWRTYDLSMKLFTGSEAQAREAAAQINRTHQPVKGATYDARDPQLGKWVWATLIYGALRGHTLFFGDLERAEKQVVLDTFRRRGALLGLRNNMSRTVDDLHRYIDEMIATGEVGVGDDAREIARLILGPVPAPLRPLTAYLARATLPAALRRQYGLSWSPLSRRAFENLVRPTANALLPHLTAEMICLEAERL